jgi:hypothetical protein
MNTVLSRNKFNEIEVIDNNVTMFVQRKDGTRVAIRIDYEDIEKVSRYTWHAIYDKTIGNYYICHRYDNKVNGKGCIKLHRLITDCPRSLEVDHINRDTTDNRKSNLRICTRFENQQNLSNCKSGQTGVYFKTRSQKWVANISKDKKRIYIGEYKTKEEAINARKEYEQKLYK